MKPILFAASETNFSNNGIGVLSDAAACIVTEERNGAFEAVLEYPVDGIHFSEISEGCFIKAKPNDTSDLQIFRLYKSSKPMNGVVTYNAEHISYMLSGNPIEEVTVSSATAQAALSAVLNAAVLPHNFSAQSNIETLNSTALSLVSSRAALGGTAGSVLDVWGGEYEFDNFVIKLHRSRGTNTGIKIAYGKNLTDFKQEKSISEVYTAVYPYAKYTPESDGSGSDSTEEVTVTLTEKTIIGANAGEYTHARILMKDFSESFSEGESITETALRSKATQWAASSGFDLPSVNVTVAFKSLWKSPEYAKYAFLERVNLCDEVDVEFPKYSISVTSKVIKTEYNSLTEQYEKIALGSAKANFADTLNKQTSEISNIKSEVRRQTASMTAKLERSVAAATNAITGQGGGYVVLNPANNPQEILVMDTPNINTAINIWRWNCGGLGHSSTGYNGPYELAMTAAGEINADFITAGTLNGGLLSAGSVEAAAISQSYRNAVEDNVQNTRREISQTFSAANEQLLSVIDEVRSDLNSTDRTISALRQSLDGLAISYSTRYKGGINIIKNSSGLNGVSDDWNYTGSVVAYQTAEAVNNTTSGSMFELSEADLAQTVPVKLGKTYTLTFIYKSTSILRDYVAVNNGGNIGYAMDTFDTAEWTACNYAFTALGNTVDIIAATAGTSLCIADIMLTEGTERQNWTPAPNEVYTENVKIDRRGINITNADSSTETIIDNTQFAVKHKDETVLTVNKDLTKLKKTEITDGLTIGKLRFSPCSDGCDLVLLD